MASPFNVTRISGVGVTALIAALLLWPFYRRFAVLEWPFAALATVAGLCGAAILIVTAVDMLFRRRGARIRPVRGFDLAFGLALTLLGLLAVQDVLGQSSV